MEEKQKMPKKKKIIIASVVLAVLAALIVASVAVPLSMREKHNEIVGKWAIVYRYTDSQGNDLNEFVSDEYFEITEKTIKYYTSDDEKTQTVFETNWKYQNSTSTNDARLKALNKYSRWYITMPDRYDDTDFGLVFYGQNCMVLGRYSTNSAKYLVLVRCDENGNPPAVTSEDTGWKDSPYTNSNGKKIDKVKTVTAIFESSTDYKVTMRINMTRFTDDTVRVEANSPTVEFPS